MVEHSKVIIQDEEVAGRSSAMSRYSNITDILRRRDADRRKLRQKINRLKTKESNLKAKLKQANNLMTNCKFQDILKRMPQNAATFIKCQIKQSGKQNKGHRFSTEEKIFSLSLFKQGPKAYRYFRNIFALPSPSTISKLLRQLPLKAGVNDVMVEYLRSVSSGLKDVDRCCSIIFDEIFLRPGLKFDSHMKQIHGFEDYGSKTTNHIADHALVFMIRGLQSNWKFPFAYYFTESGMKTVDLVKAIKDVVTAVQSCNLEILALVCDQGASKAPALNYLKNLTKQDYCRRSVEYSGTLEINNKDIQIIYDPPHLLKGLRNNLLNMDLQFSMDGEECVASWQHIVQMYEEDKNKDIRAVPKLCDYHIIKEKIKKMKVKYCSQVFSQRVASHMMVLAEYATPEIIAKEAKYTAKLLEGQSISNHPIKIIVA